MKLRTFIIHTTNIKVVGKLNLKHSHMVSLTRIWLKLTNTIQKKLKVSSTQLLYQSAPYQAAILFASGPFVDQLLTNRSVFAHKYTIPVVVCYKHSSSYNYLKRIIWYCYGGIFIFLEKMSVKIVFLEFHNHGIFSNKVASTMCSF